MDMRWRRQSFGVRRPSAGLASGKSASGLAQSTRRAQANPGLRTCEERLEFGALVYRAETPVVGRLGAEVLLVGV